MLRATILLVGATLASGVSVAANGRAHRAHHRFFGPTNSLEAQPEELSSPPPQHSSEVLHRLAAAEARVAELERREELRVDADLERADIAARLAAVEEQLARRNKADDDLRMQDEERMLGWTLRERSKV